MARYGVFPQFLRAPRRATNAPVPALMLNVGGFPLHHGGVGVIRSLGRMGVPVYAVVDDRFTPASLCRYLTGAILWDTRSMDAGRFLDGMTRIGQRLKRRTVVIPTGDVAASLVAEHAAVLAPWFLVPKQPATLPRTLANKKELWLLCNRIGVPCPRTICPACMEDVHDFIAQVSFPVVVKAAAAWQLPQGGRTTFIARSPEEVYAVYQDAAKNRQPSMILQEYIDPEQGEDWFYHGYRNAQTDCMVGFTGRKLRSYPAFAGPTTLGKAAANQPLRQRSEKLLQAICYSGICDLDFRLDRRSGEFYLLDFNPRIGAQFRLFEDKAGIDVARALYLDLTGKRVGQRGDSRGRTFLAEFHDVAASLSYFRRGKLTLREWSRSLRGRRELAWFSKDDPLPFIATCTRLLLRVAGRLLHNLQVARIHSSSPRSEGQAHEAAPEKHNTSVLSGFSFPNHAAQPGVLKCQDSIR